MHVNKPTREKFLVKVKRPCNEMETTQYDSHLGGSQDLPPSISLLKFTAARYKEIQAMRQSLKSSSSVKLAFQKLPVHMRRRAMSHNVKRLPCRLREMHLNQLKKSGQAPKLKTPSRKHRRRPRNLLEEYARRRRRVQWLETHIWHAKRFHMVEKWGCRLGDRPCDKAFRACYRASARHCLLQDISYFRCVEIVGEQAVLVGRLRGVSEGMSMGAKAFLRGNREGRTVLFQPGCCPKRAIGTVFFNWKPIDSNVLWVWLHPAFYDEALNVLVEVFEAAETENRTFTNERLKISIRELRFELNRFRLTGPLSQAVLRDSLRLTEANHPSEWFQSYLSDGSNRQGFSNQIDYWTGLDCIANPAELPPHTTLSLIVNDPRFNLPSKRTKATNPTETYKQPSLVNETDISTSPLWNESIRDNVKQNKISNAAIAEMRSRLLVPGSELEEPGAPVPIVLIQRPGNSQHYGAGWDVIIPANWAQTFWMAFIMRGARAGGLRETASIDFEMGLTAFLPPDTSAGLQEESDTTDACKDRYFKLPPNKRTNYNKYSIANPFSYNWTLLVGEWLGGNVEEIRVLRDRKLLGEIRELFTKKAKNVVIDFNTNFVVPVTLKVAQKGCPKQFSVICLPQVGDLKEEPVEPKKFDVNEIKRKELRQQHKRLLQTLKRRRKRAKSKKGEVSAKPRPKRFNFHIVSPFEIIFFLILIFSIR